MVIYSFTTDNFSITHISPLILFETSALSTMSKLERAKKLAKKRVIKEYKKLMESRQEVGVSAEPNPEDIFHWHATMLG